MFPQDMLRVMELPAKVETFFEKHCSTKNRLSCITGDTGNICCARKPNFSELENQ